MGLKAEIDADVVDAFNELDDIPFFITIYYESGGTFDASQGVTINRQTISGQWRGVRAENSSKSLIDFPTDKTMITIIFIASEMPFTIVDNIQYYLTIDGINYEVKAIDIDPADITYTFVAVEM